PWFSRDPQGSAGHALPCGSRLNGWMVNPPCLASPVPGKCRPPATQPHAAWRLPVSPAFRILLCFPFWRRWLGGLGIAYVAIVLTLGGTRDAKPFLTGVGLSWALFLGMHYYQRQERPSTVALSRSRRPRSDTRALVRVERYATGLIVLLAGAEVGL